MINYILENDGVRIMVGSLNSPKLLVSKWKVLVEISVS